IGSFNLFSLKISLGPVMQSVDITGIPADMASTIALGNPSFKDDDTYNSHFAIYLKGLFLYPINKIFLATPLLFAISFISFSSSPLIPIIINPASGKLSVTLINDLIKCQ